MGQIKFIFLLCISICLENAKGLTWISINPIFNSTCEGGSIIMAWEYTRDSGETVVLREWKKSNGTGRVIEVGDYDGVMVTEATGYTNRLKLIGSAGLEITKTTPADAGTYYVFITTLNATHNATATVSVYVIPNDSCIPRDESSGKNLTCFIPDACPVRNESKASWNINGHIYEYEYMCTSGDSGKTYKCCAVGNATDTCSSRKLCIEHTCAATAITPVDFITSSTLMPIYNTCNRSVSPTSVDVVTSDTVISTDNMGYSDASLSSKSRMSSL